MECTRSPANEVTHEGQTHHANTATEDLDKAEAFYGRILGLERLMDHGWFRTYGSDERMRVQVSFGAEGGSGTEVPDLSIEVDDLETALARFEEASVPIEYGPVSEPGACGVSTFATRSASSSISCSTSE